MAPARDLKAWVLHSRPWLHGMQMTELLTDGLGRLAVLGRRAGRKSGQVLLQPFVPLQVEIRGRGDLRRLVSWEAEGYLDVPPASLARALQVHALVLKAFERLEGRDVFAPYCDFLEGLCRARGDRDSGRRVELRFRCQLLAASGYAFSRERDVRARPLEGQRRYGFAPGQGWVPLDAAEESLGEWATGAEIANWAPPEDPQALGRWERLLHGMLGAAVEDSSSA